MRETRRWLCALGAGLWLSTTALAGEASLGEDIDSLAGYLVAAVGAEGRMVYLRDADGSAGNPRRYNLLRHAGALHALADYLDEQPNAEGAEALRRGLDYLLAHVATVPGMPGALALWSAGTPREAKLGGAGLTLLALASAERVLPGVARRKTLRGLATFVLSMQRADGSFHSKYLDADGGRRDDWVSLYYPGEAALGLLAAYELEPDTAWLHAAIRALAYLARHRAGAASVPADHWALIATARLFESNAAVPALAVRRALLGHVEQVARLMLAEQAAAALPWAPHFGAFTADARTAPSATRVEALLAVLDVLPPTRASLRADIDCALRDAVAFLRRALLRTGPAAGGMPRRMLSLRGDFSVRDTEIRIDYVQHALSALLGARRRSVGGECRR